MTSMVIFKNNLLFVFFCDHREWVVNNKKRILTTKDTKSTKKNMN